MANQRFYAVTPAATAAFTYIDKPDTDPQKGKNMFKVTFVMNEDDVQAFRDKAMEAARAEWPKMKKAALEKLDLGCFSGADKAAEDDEWAEKNPDWHDKFIGKASSKRQPQLLDSARNPLPAGVYPSSGDLIKVSVTFNPNDGFGSKRVSCWVNKIMLLEKRAGEGGGGGEEFDDESDNYKPFDAATSSDDGQSKDDADF